MSTFVSCGLKTTKRFAAIIILMKTFIHRKYGRYRQDTDMYKRQKQMLMLML